MVKGAIENMEPSHGHMSSFFDPADEKEGNEAKEGKEGKEAKGKEGKGKKGKGKKKRKRDDSDDDSSDSSDDAPKKVTNPNPLKLPKMDKSQTVEWSARLHQEAMHCLATAVE